MKNESSLMHPIADYTFRFKPEGNTNNLPKDLKFSSGFVKDSDISLIQNSTIKSDEKATENGQILGKTKLKFGIDRILKTSNPILNQTEMFKRCSSINFDDTPPFHNIATFFGRTANSNQNIELKDTLPERNSEHCETTVDETFNNNASFLLSYYSAVPYQSLYSNRSNIQCLPQANNSTSTIYNSYPDTFRQNHILHKLTPEPSIVYPETDVLHNNKETEQLDESSSGNKISTDHHVTTNLLSGKHNLLCQGTDAFQKKLKPCMVSMWKQGFKQCCTSRSLDHLMRPKNVTSAILDDTLAKHSTKERIIFSQSDDVFSDKTASYRKALLLKQKEFLLQRSYQSFRRFPLGFDVRNLLLSTQAQDFNCQQIPYSHLFANNTGANSVATFEKPKRSSPLEKKSFSLLGSSKNLSLRPHYSNETSRFGMMNSASQIEYNDFGGQKKGRKWSRAVFSMMQRKGLESSFRIQKYVAKPDRKSLAEALGLTDSQVKIWFQNRRMKWRQEQKNHTKSNLNCREGVVDLSSTLEE